ncbi:type VI secretion system baseplate subunit TssF [Paraburkholderia gardini]|uniref:type VI secretion system baseplate subunit TssF n=1 Tax=Paraburkholderia gardini TaxID=2823469 RepID=UPI001DFA8B57|nr:type VI secretion system baseplate subunit TssF [Paraburkholderia gardini]CAG4893500.1 hypothetical protein R69919_01664 [Paraburkholderia gardini]
MTAPWKSFQHEDGNPFLGYFDAEMRYLHEAGRAFARDQPDASHAEWSVLVPKAQWKKTDPVRLVAAERNLDLDRERQK